MLMTVISRIHGGCWLVSIVANGVGLSTRRLPQTNTKLIGDRMASETALDMSSFAKQFAQQVWTELRQLIAVEQTKEWYSTEELAKAVGKKPFTVREHWCNAGRVECEKDAAGKWRIPGHEYRRLVNGGAIGPKR
jgi:hypothetical protein